MRKFFNTYSAFVKAGVQNMITYKGDFIGLFIGQIFYCFVMFFIWKAVFKSSSSDIFMNFSFLDMTTYIFLTNVTVFLIDSDVSFNIGGEIRDGNISMRMIKPININTSYLAMEFGTKIIAFCFIFIPVICGIEIYRCFYTGEIQFNVGTLLIYLISILISYLLSFYIKSIFGYIAFFVTNIWGVNILKESIIKFFSGAIIPIAFFPNLIQKIFSILPFASLNYTPVMIYMNKYSGANIVKAIALQVFWLVVFFIIVQIIDNKSRKYLSIQGG